MARSARDREPPGSPARAIEPVNLELTGYEGAAAHEIDEELQVGRGRPMFSVPRWSARDWVQAHGWVQRLRGHGGSLRCRWRAHSSRRRRFEIIGLAAVLLVSLGAVAVLTRPGTPAQAVTRDPQFRRHPPPLVPTPAYSSDLNLQFDDETPATGPALTVPGGAVRDVAVASDDLYVVTASALSVVDAYSREVLRKISVGSNPGARILLDVGRGTGWVIDAGSTPAVAREFDLVSLKQTRYVSIEAIVYATGVLDGRLYLATSTGVYLVAPGASTLTPVAASIPPIQAISVDSAQHTLLGLTSGAGARIITIGDEGAHVQAGSTINVSHPTIAIMNDALWVGSVGVGARLERFDESTMRPLPEGAGGVVVQEGVSSRFAVSAGVTDLWVYEATKQQLYCVDSQSGLILQRWSGITQSVATGGSGPYAVSNHQVVPLVLRGNCQG